ncbi:MAG: glutamine synthetase beta-grasp domain-containing protein, partial [Armatimonadota bacterium]
MVGDRPSADVAVSPARAIEMAKSQGVQIVDLRFTDLFGMWQHFSIPVKELSSEFFEEGIGFDGSSIRGFQHIHESDLLLMADAASAIVDPLSRIPTMLLTCDVYDPVTHDRYTRDPRYVAQKAEQHLKTSGIATTAYFGPEAEFFVFD